MTNATIITIGDELLIGQVIDTNSAWMAQELNKAGIPVVRRVAVGDVWEEIWDALDEESKHADIILITGGLGPTADDITKPLLCKYFGGQLVVDAAARQNVIDIFKRLNRPMIERNLLQAEVPDTCTVIQNKRGVADHDHARGVSLHAFICAASLFNRDRDGMDGVTIFHRILLILILVA